MILSSSGMATGGRVLGHLAALAPDPENAIVFPGFQVPGSRGGKPISGAPDIKVMTGRHVAVKAQVHHLGACPATPTRRGWPARRPQAEERLRLQDLTDRQGLRGASRR